MITRQKNTDVGREAHLQQRGDVMIVDRLGEAHMGKIHPLSWREITLSRAYARRGGNGE